MGPRLGNLGSPSPHPQDRLLIDLRHMGRVPQSLAAFALRRVVRTLVVMFLVTVAGLVLLAVQLPLKNLYGCRRRGAGWQDPTTFDRSPFEQRVDKALQLVLEALRSVTGVDIKTDGLTLRSRYVDHLGGNELLAKFRPNMDGVGWLDRRGWQQVGHLLQERTSGAGAD